MQALAGVDDSYILVPLPFAFRYWARDLPTGSMVYLCTNGYIGMDGMPSVVLSGMLPATTAPNAVIAVHWRDLVSTGPLCVATVGVTPNRRWVLEWSNSRDYSGSGSGMVFEVILSEGTNTIDFVYRTASSASVATRGLEDQAGMSSAPGCLSPASTSCAVSSGTTVRFQPIP